MAIELVAFVHSIASSGTSFTFTGVDLGAAAADRYLIALVGGRRTGANVVTKLSNLTIAGAATTEVASVVDDPLASVIRRTSAALTSGTTGTVVATWDSVMDSTWVAIYRATRLVSVTPVDVETSSIFEGATSLALDVAPGMLLAAATGLVIDGSYRFGSAASRLIGSTQSSYVVGAEITTSGINWSGVDLDGLADLSEGPTQPRTGITLAAACFQTLTDAEAGLVGVAAAPAVGALGSTGGASAGLVGVTASPAARALAARGGASASLPGVAASAVARALAASGGARGALSGVAATPGIGTLIAQQGSTAALTGIAASAGVGVLAARGGVALVLEGVEADAGVGELLVVGAFDADFLRRPDGEAQYLIEIAAYRPTGGGAGLEVVGGTPLASVPPGETGGLPGQIILRFADRDWVGAPDDSVQPNVWYDGRVSLPLRAERTAPLYPEEGRRLQRQFGGVEFLNGDARMDRISSEFTVDGREVRILLGRYMAPYAEFTPVAVMVSEGWQPGESEARLNLRDVAALLERPAQKNIYGGTGDADGTAELAGRAKPLTYGEAANITPVLLSPLHLIYQVHDGEIDAVTAVYDRAGRLYLDESIGDAGDVADWDALIAADPDASHYVTCKGLGLFKLASSPAGLITADVRGDAAGGYTTSLDQIAQRLIARADYPLTQIDMGSFASLASVAGPVQLYAAADNAVTTAALLDELVASAGGWWGPSRLGRLRAGRIVIPEEQEPTLSFDQWDILLILAEPRPIPRWRHRVAYARNWTVQRGEDLDVTVTEDRRQYLAAEYRIAAPASAANGTLLTSHLAAIDPPVVSTLLQDAARADELATTFQRLFGVPRRIFQIKVKRLGWLVDLGQVVRISYPRFGLEAGRNFIVVGMSEDATSEEIDMRVWG